MKWADPVQLVVDVLAAAGGLAGVHVGALSPNLDGETMTAGGTSTAIDEYVRVLYLGGPDTVPGGFGVEDHLFEIEAYVATTSTTDPWAVLSAARAALHGAAGTSVPVVFHDGSTGSRVVRHVRDDSKPTPLPTWHGSSVQRWRMSVVVQLRTRDNEGIN